MAYKSLLIIGSGKRVCNDALPALQCLPDISINKIFARSVKTIKLDSEEFVVDAFSSLKASDIDKVDLIYMAVKQPSVAEVLVKLASFDLSGLDLLIETPVIPFNDLGYFGLFDNFRNVWVAEDCTKLPCFDVINQKEVRKINLDRAGYKYHGIALLKHLLACSEITSVSRGCPEGDFTKDCFNFSNLNEGVMTSPRDYDDGTFTLTTAQNTISDIPQHDDSDCLIEPILEKNFCKGFTLKDRKTIMEECETELLGKWEQGVSITSKMHDLKRVGLYRMFKDIMEGRGSYPLLEGTNDMTISYFLDNLGFYKNISLMKHNSRVGRRLVKVATISKRILGKLRNR